MGVDMLGVFIEGVPPGVIMEGVAPPPEGVAFP